MLESYRGKVPGRRSPHPKGRGGKCSKEGKKKELGGVWVQGEVSLAFQGGGKKKKPLFW